MSSRLRSEPWSEQSQCGINVADGIVPLDFKRVLQPWIEEFLPLVSETIETVLCVVFGFRRVAGVGR